MLDKYRPPHLQWHLVYSESLNYSQMAFHIHVLLGFFWPRVSGLTLGAPLGAHGTLRVPPLLIAPHLGWKPYKNMPPSSIVTMLYSCCLHWSVICWTTLSNLYLPTTTIYQIIDIEIATESTPRLFKNTFTLPLPALSKCCHSLSDLIRQERRTILFAPLPHFDTFLFILLLSRNLPGIFLNPLRTINNLS